MVEEIKISGGLRPTPEDKRDYSHDRVFGAILPPLTDIPNDFMVAEPLEIKDQRLTDFCTGFTVASVSEDQEGIPLSPEFQFMLTKLVDGNPDAWGSDIRAACSAACDYGSLPRTDAPYTVADQQRDFLVNSYNWPQPLFKKSVMHRKQNFLKVDGPYDRFDNFRRTMWMHRAERRTLVTGAMWRGAWTMGYKGIIPDEYGQAEFGHAFKIAGVATKTLDGVPFPDGKPRLVAILSNGEQIGDRGRFYFTREIINKEFFYGAYIFKDLTAQQIADLKYVYANPYSLRSLIAAFKRIFGRV